MEKEPEWIKRLKSALDRGDDAHVGRLRNTLKKAGRILDIEYRTVWDTPLTGRTSWRITTRKRTTDYG